MRAAVRSIEVRGKQAVAELRRRRLRMVLEKFDQKIFIFEVAELRDLLDGIVCRGKIALDIGEPFARDVLFEGDVEAFIKEFGKVV